MKKLVIAGTPGSRCEDMTVQCGGSAQTADVDVLGTEFERGALNERLGESDHVGAVLFYARPERVLAGAFSLESDPDGQIEEWKNAADELLSAFRRYRPRILLFEDEAVRKNPEAVRALVSERLRQNLQVSPNGSGENSTAPTAVEHAIAGRYVSASPELSDVVGELEAAAIPLTAGAPDSVASIMEAYREYRELVQERDRLAEVSKVAERDKVEIRAQSEELTQDLESSRQKVAELKSELEKLKSEQQEATHDSSVAVDAVDSDRAKELEDENELLLLQLHQVQEELEQYYLEATDRNQRRSSVSEYELQELAKYSLSLENLLLKLLRSRTWKVMAPVRQAGRIVKGIVRGRRVPRTRLPKRPPSLVRIAGERT